MGNDDSVMVQLRLLEAGDPRAAEELWDRYFARLVRLASNRLGTAARRDFDEEDVALSVFHNLAKCAQDKKLTDVVMQEQLWRLLVTFTAQKVIDRVRATKAQKRGGGQVRGESIFHQGSNDDARVGLDAFFGADPTPETLVEMDEHFQRLLEMLPEDVFRQIALQRLQGSSNDDIARQLAVSPRTIERKCNIIRSIWENEVESLE